MSRGEIKELFDIQINRMLAVIDEQYDRTNKNHPGTQIVGRPWASMQRSSADQVLGLLSSFRRSRQLSLRPAMPQAAL